MQRQAIAARARPDVMQPGTRDNGEAMGAGTPPLHPSVYSGDAAAAHYFYQQYGPGGGTPRSMLMCGSLPPKAERTAKGCLSAIGRCNVPPTMRPCSKP